MSNNFAHILPVGELLFEFKNKTYTFQIVANSNSSKSEHICHSITENFLQSWVDQTKTNLGVSKSYYVDGQEIMKKNYSKSNFYSQLREGEEKR